MNSMDRAGDGVFTTLPWDGGNRLCAVDLHLDRLRRHADVLGILWPDDIALLLATAFDAVDQTVVEQGDSDDCCRPPGLLRIELHQDGSIHLEARSNEHNLALGEVDAITLSAPEEGLSTLGVKRLDWSLYREAGETARDHGADAALLVRGRVIIDGDRATPMLLLADGTAWVCSAEHGAVDSVTLEMVCGAMLRTGIPFNSGMLTVKMFTEAEEGVLVGSGMGISALSTVDGRVIGSGSRRLHRQLSGILSERMEESWMTFEEVVNNH